MSEQLSTSTLTGAIDGTLLVTNPDVLIREMSVELLHLRAVVANAIELINSGRCGLGHDVLITRKLNHE